MAHVDQAIVFELQAENAALRTRVSELEKRLEFLGNHQTFARGIAGEKLISRLIGGALTTHTAPNDLYLSDGIGIEVKFSNISRSKKGYEGGRRWQWQKIFGERNAKKYDYLFLVGESDPAHLTYYSDQGNPYVIFVIPYDAVLPLTTAGVRGARAISISTNPQSARGTSAALYRTFQRTFDEVQAQFGDL